MAWQMVGSRLGNTDGSTEMVGSRLGSADGSTEMVGSRLGSDEGLSDGTGLGRPEGPKVGKAEGLSDWVGAAEGKGDDMARSNCDRIELNCFCEWGVNKQDHFRILRHAGKKTDLKERCDELG